MEITGKIRSCKDTQQVTDKFSKREFIVETNEQYPQTIQLELQGQNCDIIDAYKIGQEVTVGINIRGRIWQNPQGEEKCFNTLVAWRIQPSNAPVGGNQSQTQTSPLEAKPMTNGGDEDDDLPF